MMQLNYGNRLFLTYYSDKLEPIQWNIQMTLST